MVGEFEKHIRDAIRINWSRRHYYSEVSGGRSRLLSWWLILSEVLCLPLARYFDWRARRFNAQGVGVVRDDFIDMANIKPETSPPIWTHRAEPEAFAAVANSVSVLREQALESAKVFDFAAVARETAMALESVITIENSAQAHFMMTRHLLESIGLAALHAHDYVGQNGEVKALCRQLVVIQVRLAGSGLMMDKLAQRTHARGAGILINDVPHIPFLERFYEHPVGQAVSKPVTVAVEPAV